MMEPSKTRRSARLATQIKTRLLVSVLAVSAAFAPLPSHATIAVEPQIRALQAMRETWFDYLNEMVDWYEEYLVWWIEQSANTIIAATEKRNGVDGNLTQSDLNYDAALYLAQRGAEAEDRYRAPSAEPINACATQQTTASINNAAANARVNGKAIAEGVTRKMMYTTNAAQAAHQTLEDYYTNYCTAEDVQRGRCATAAPAHMQGANLDAGTLLTPNGGETYTDAEFNAARSFINLVTPPAPAEMLPVAVERTPAGQRFVFEQMQVKALISGAAHSLSQILANHTSDAALNTTAAGPAENISVVGLMKKFVEDKFGNPQYVIEVQGKDEQGLLRELGLLMAARNWMDYNAFLQAERIEANLALQLAIKSRDRAERELAMARQAANQSRK